MKAKGTKKRLAYFIGTHIEFPAFLRRLGFVDSQTMRRGAACAIYKLTTDRVLRVWVDHTDPLSRKERFAKKYTIEIAEREGGLEQDAKVIARIDGRAKAHSQVRQAMAIYRGLTNVGPSAQIRRNSRVWCLSHGAGTVLEVVHGAGGVCFNVQWDLTASPSLIPAAAVEPESNSEKLPTPNKQKGIKPSRAA